MPARPSAVPARLLRAALAALIGAGLLATLLALAPRDASAATQWTVSGRGWGHGIGMSQWGAYGQAKDGRSWRTIIKTYYSNTDIGDAPSKRIRVLVSANRSRVTFSGARKGCGRTLKRTSTYQATRFGDRTVLRSATGRKLRSCDVLRAFGTVRVHGTGSFRSRVAIRHARGSGLNVINELPLDSYVMGVVANESPASWPAEALRAQAVAARTYALTTDVGGLGYDQYNDTRSQVFGGKDTETDATNAATRDTGGKVVTYGGLPIPTFFFSTSGGRTEDIQSGFVGSSPRPYLVSVSDPWDSASPYHTWGPLTYSSSGLASGMGLSGSLREVDVTERGAGRRIVHASVRTSSGTTRLTGPQIQARLGLRSSWITFRGVSSHAVRTARSARAAGIDGTLETTVTPVPSNPVTVQVRRDKRWHTYAKVKTDAGGSLSLGVPAGRYRVVSGSAVGPAVHVG